MKLVEKLNNQNTKLGRRWLNKIIKMPFIPSSIDNLLKETELTQRKLAAKVGVPQSTLFRWKDGIMTPRDKNIDSLYRVAQAYGLEIEFYIPPKRK